MNRYAIVAFLLAVFGAPAMAQVPITGALPPWMERFKITDNVFVTLKAEKVVPDSVLVKLIPLKDKEFTREGLEQAIKKLLDADESKKFQSLILKQAPWSPTIWTAPPQNSPPHLPPYFTQAPSPALIQVPSGKPLVGFYKMEAELVGADGRYPFDSGEYNLAGFGGNARIFGQFVITLPPPADVEPLNAPIPYRSFRGMCRNR
jgi:hypothetical protein